MPSPGKHTRSTITYSKPFTMDQEMNSHSAINTTSAYSARDYRKGLYKVTMVLFGVMHPTPLGLVTFRPSICMGNALDVDFFIIISFRDLSLRQVDLFS